MWRHILCAVFLVAISLTMVVAEEIKGRLLKVDGTRITFKVGKEGKAKDYDTVKDIKVYTQKKGEEKMEVKEGLAAAILKKISAEKGKAATITTNKDDKVTALIVNVKK